MSIESAIGSIISHRTENFVTDDFGNLWQEIELLMFEIGYVEEVKFSEFPDHFFAELEEHKDSWKYRNKDMS